MNRKIMAVISVLLCLSFLFAFAGCDSTGGEEETTTVTYSAKTPLPTDITTSVDEEGYTVTDTTYSPEDLAKNTATIFEYFNLHVNELKAADYKAKIEMSQGKSIGKAKDAEGNDLPMSDNDYINAAITSLDSYMLHNDGASIEYGDDVKAFLPVKGAAYVSSLTLDEIESATCVDKDNQRTITVTLKTPSLPATIEKAYDMGNVDDVMAEFKKADKYLTIEKPTLEYKDCQIIIIANLETDEVHTIEYKKNIDVKTVVTGTGSLENIPATPVTFRYSNTIKYTLDNTDPADAAVAE